MVSYEKDSDTCRGIRIESPFVANQIWGRGVAVVGGDDISVSNVRLIGSSSAGIYVGVEGAPVAMFRNRTREATAVQIVWSSRKASRQIEHLGSAHNEAQLEALKAAAAQRLAAGQQSMDLDLEQAGAADGGPLEIVASCSQHLWEALCCAYRVLGVRCRYRGR